MKACYAAALAALLAGTLPAAAQDRPVNQEVRTWPQYRGPDRTGCSAETGLLPVWPKEGPKLLWNSKQVNNGQGIGKGVSSVSVAGGKIFTMGDLKPSCFVIALDEATGKQVWATAIGPSVDGGTAGPRCTPTYDGDRVFALGRRGDFVCLNSATGEILWRKHFQKDFGGKAMASWDYCESPLVDGDRVICTPGADKAAVVALDRRTGNVIWKAAVPGCNGAGYSSIAVAEVGGIKQYLNFMGRGLVSIDARTGKLLWRYDRVTNGTGNISMPLVKGDLVFASTGYNTGAALLQMIPSADGVQVKELYFLKGNKLQNHHGGMVLVGDYVYGGHGHNNGMPFCLDLKEGAFKWGPVRGPGSGSSTVLYADGKLYYRFENGTMALVEATPREYKLISSFPLPGYTGTPSWAHLVIVNGRLYVRGDGVLLCYDLRQR
jgi:outer membrane protein assembly factor BamB